MSVQEGSLDGAEIAQLKIYGLGRLAERADVLAFLRKRRAAALKVASRNPEEADRAKIIADQIGIEIEMIEQGLHVGDAEAEAALSGEG